MAGDGPGNGAGQFGVEECRVERGAEFEEAGNSRGVGRRSEQQTAVLENCALSAALGAADDFGAPLVDDVIGIAAEEAQKVFLVGRGAGFRVVDEGGVAAEFAGGITAAEQIDYGEMNGLIELGWVVPRRVIGGQDTGVGPFVMMKDGTAA